MCEFIVAAAQTIIIRVCAKPESVITWDVQTLNSLVGK